MSGNRSRRKGQAGELAAQKELQRFGAVYTRYYTAQQASADGIPDFVVRDPFSTRSTSLEVKSAARLEIPAWIAQAAYQSRGSNGIWSLLIRRTQDPAWYVLSRLDQLHQNARCLTPYSNYVLETAKHLEGESGH